MVIQHPEPSEMSEVTSSLLAAINSCSGKWSLRAFVVWVGIPLPLLSSGFTGKVVKSLLRRLLPWPLSSPCARSALGGHLLKEQKGWNSQVTAFCYCAYENFLTGFTNTGPHTLEGQTLVCKTSLLMGSGFSSPLNFILALSKPLNLVFLLVKQEFCPCLLIPRVRKG